MVGRFALTARQLQKLCPKVRVPASTLVLIFMAVAFLFQLVLCFSFVGAPGSFIGSLKRSTARRRGQAHP
jgi:hypothetical protein